MKTSEALKLYEWAENIVKQAYPGLPAVERAGKIDNLLTLEFDEDTCDEIIELVFEHEFTPAGLNKHE